MVALSRSGRLNPKVRIKAQQGIVLLVLRIFHDAWPFTVSDSRVNRATDEDSITDVLRWQMEDAKSRISPPPQLTFVREPQSDDPELDSPTGLIDIMVRYDWDASVYLTMECKKITSKGNSLARKYVLNGVNRFASCKYGRGHAFGIITGYVICDNPDECADRVRRQLAKKQSDEAGYDPEFGWQVDDDVFPGVRHYRSRHRQLLVTNTIELVHVFAQLT